MSNVKEKNVFIENNMSFANLPIATAGLFLAVCGSFLGWGELSVVFVFLSGMAFFACFYSYKSGKSVRCEIAFLRSSARIGDSVILTCKVINAGKLPLVNGMVRIPLQRSSILDPESSAYYRNLTTDEAGKARMYQVDTAGAIEFPLPMLWQGEAAEYEAELTALQRGEEKIEQIYLYFGDLLGMRKSCLSLGMEDLAVIVHVPAVPVDIQPFLRAQEECYSGAKGTRKDLTLLHHIREYEHGDSAKHINWNIFAKEQKLRVDVHDYMKMAKIHFIFDGESFNNRFADKNEFERTLEVIRSLITRLNERGLRCGITLPRGNETEPVTIVWQNHFSTEAIDQALARYHMIHTEPEETVKFTILQEHSSLSSTIIKAREQKIEREEIQINRSEYEFSQLIRYRDGIERFYYVTYDARKVKDPFTGIIPKEKMVYVSYRSNPSAARHRDQTIICLTSIAREIKHGTKK